MIAKGIIWLIVVGSFNNDKYKIENISNLLVSNILDTSIRLINWINIVKKNKVKILNLIFKETKYFVILYLICNL